MGRLEPSFHLWVVEGGGVNASFDFRKMLNAPLELRVEVLLSLLESKMRKGSGENMGNSKYGEHPGLINFI